MTTQTWTAIVLIALSASNLLDLLIIRQLRNLIIGLYEDVRDLEDALAFTHKSVDRLEVVVKSLATKKDKK